MLTLLEPAGDSAAWPRALLKVGPATVARHQLTLALAMECQRVICLAGGISPEIIALQHAVEESGAKFHLIHDTLALSGLISASDELLVIGDGVLTNFDSARSRLDQGYCVFVQPVDVGLSAGFERIDLVHADAGLMRLPGKLVEALRDLPPDCAAHSSLLRIALQAAIARVEIPAEAREGGRWLIVKDEQQAHVIEADWMDAQLASVESRGPSDMLARLGVRQFGSALLHAGSNGNALAAGSASFALMAIGAGWFGLTAGALVVLALAFVFRRFAGNIIEIERLSLHQPAHRLPRDAMFGWFHDALMLALLVWADTANDHGALHERLFAPLILICLLHIVPRLMSSRWAFWLADRAIVDLVLAGAFLSGYGEHSVMLVAGAFAVIGALYPGRRPA